MSLDVTLSDTSGIPVCFLGFHCKHSFLLHQSCILSFLSYFAHYFTKHISLHLQICCRIFLCCLVNLKLQFDCQRLMTMHVHSKFRKCANIYFVGWSASHSRLKPCLLNSWPGHSNVFIISFDHIIAGACEYCENAISMFGRYTNMQNTVSINQLPFSQILW